MRCDQHMGLNLFAAKFIAGEQIPVGRYERIYDDPNRAKENGIVYENSVKAEDTNQTYEGMFGDTYVLSAYALPDGRMIREFLQASPWSSGPCFFLALEELQANGEWIPIPESLWSQEEIDNA